MTTNALTLKPGADDADRTARRLDRRRTAVAGRRGLAGRSKRPPPPCSAIVAKGDAAYGINTGFGLLAKTRIPDEKLEQLQRNLILSHSVGTGELLSDAVCA